MSYALSNHISGKRRRKRYKRKITMADGMELNRRTLREG